MHQDKSYKNLVNLKYWKMPSVFAKSVAHCKEPRYCAVLLSNILSFFCPIFFIRLLVKYSVSFCPILCQPPFQSLLSCEIFCLPGSNSIPYICMHQFIDLFLSNVLQSSFQYSFIFLSCFMPSSCLKFCLLMPNIMSPFFQFSVVLLSSNILPSVCTICSCLLVKYSVYFLSIIVSDGTADVVDVVYVNILT